MCHLSVIGFVKDVVGDGARIRGASVLEVGSYNVNGSPRTFIAPHMPSEYIGIDKLPGPGVDIMMDAESLVSKYGPERFDVVVSTEMLEHASDWRLALWNMCAVLKPSGFMIVTTRSPGFPRHGFPGDFWRFTFDDFAAIFAGFTSISLMNDLDIFSPGVFFAGTKDREISIEELNFVRPSTVEGAA